MKYFSIGDKLTISNYKIKAVVVGVTRGRKAAVVKIGEPLFTSFRGSAVMHEIGKWVSRNGLTNVPYLEEDSLYMWVYTDDVESIKPMIMETE